MTKDYVKTFKGVKKLYQKQFEQNEKLLIEKQRQRKQLQSIKGSNNMLEIKDSGIAVKKIVHDWTPMPRPMRKSYRALEADKIYVYVRANTFKKNKEKGFLLTVYIGSEIMSLLNLVPKNRMKVLLDKNNPNYLRLIKTHDDELTAYTINRNASTSTCHVDFRYAGLLMLKEGQTTEVEFDLFNDSSFMINISNFKARGGLSHVSL
jgi:hypothetical protein